MTRSFPRNRRGRHWLHRAVAGYRNGRDGTQSNADPGYRNGQPGEHHADAWDRNYPESLRHTYRRASERRASGRRASERKGPRTLGLRTPGSPAPSRTSRRKPRQVSPTNHVQPTSDFRTGNRCALVFRDFPFIDRTIRRNSPSPARARKPVRVNALGVELGCPPIGLAKI